MSSLPSPWYIVLYFDKLSNISSSFHRFVNSPVLALNFQSVFDSLESNLEVFDFIPHWFFSDFITHPFFLITISHFEVKIS